jgi:uncharacterized SAM-dependent methyltransferase
VVTVFTIKLEQRHGGIPECLENHEQEETFDAITCNLKSVYRRIKRMESTWMSSDDKTTVRIGPSLPQFAVFSKSTATLDRSTL